MSTIGLQKVHKAELHYPRHGTAWAQVATVAGVVPLGPAVLTIRDLALAGTVINGGENSPASWVGIWVSGDAWDTVLPSRAPYQNDAGVRLKSVLTDLATDCSTSIALPADAPVGTHWQRAALAGNRRARTGRDELATLQRLSHFPAWWVDAAGVTRFAIRTGAPVKAVARVISRDLTVGRRTLGVDAVAPWTPGNSFEGVTIERTIIREDSGNLMLETWEQ